MSDKTKIKYLNPEFRKKLNEARGYKRAVKKIPEKPLGIFLSRVKLDSLKAKIFITLCFGLLAYLLFIPNFIFIKHINILGIHSSNLPTVEACVHKYLSQPFYWPQKNLLLLSKNKLLTHLQNHCEGISKVSKIDKKFFNTLLLTLEARYEKYLLTNSNGNYLLANDGYILKELNPDLKQVSSTTLNGLIIFNTQLKQPLYEKQFFPENKYFPALTELLNWATHKLQNPILKLNLIDEIFNDVELFTQTGYKLKINLNYSLKEQFQNLESLLKDISQSRINGVKYIDLRVKDKAFVCYKDGFCAKETPILPQNQTPNSTSTPLTQ